MLTGRWLPKYANAGVATKNTVARTAVVRAVRGGTLPRRRLEQAAARQIALLTHLAGTGKT